MHGKTDRFQAFLAKSAARELQMAPESFKWRQRATSGGQEQNIAHFKACGILLGVLINHLRN